MVDPDTSNTYDELIRRDRWEGYPKEKRSGQETADVPKE